MFGDVLFFGRFFQKPRAGGVCVRQGFLGGEGFGGDEEKGRGGAADAKSFHDMGRVDIGDEVEAKVAPGKGLEGFRDHHGTEVGSSDPDIDDVGDRLTGISLPVSGSDFL